MKQAICSLMRLGAARRRKSIAESLLEGEAGGMMALQKTQNENSTSCRPSCRRVNGCTVRKCDVVGKLALRQKVCRSGHGDSLEMLRPGLLPALRRIGSASTGGCNPSRGSVSSISFSGREGNSGKNQN
jgi:hypothetical protein